MEAHMELHIRFLGLDLLTFYVSTEHATAEAVDESPGDCTTFPIGFAGTHEVPDEAGPYREGWE